MNERIKKLRKIHLKLTQDEFSKKINISRANLGSIEVGRINVTDRVINDICNAFNVNEEWLRNGEGEMFIQPDVFSLDEQAKKSNLSELEIAVMRGYMELDHNTRETIMAKLESIIQQRSEIAATMDPLEAEVESYRRELEDVKKVQTLLASQEQKGLSG